MLKFLTDYKSLTGYLHRFTLARIGRLHIRFHRILDVDATPYQHSHPFAYVSLILSGGYTEKVENQYLTHSLLSLILRKSNVTHQIVHVKPRTLTLFIAWARKDNHWEIKRTGDISPKWIEPESGVYARHLYGKMVFSKFDGFWHQSALSIDDALKSVRPSINQATSGQFIRALD